MYGDFHLLWYRLFSCVVIKCRSRSLMKENNGTDIERQWQDGHIENVTHGMAFKKKSA